MLPYKFCYLISDFVFFVLRRVFKYRLKVVKSNLKASFPSYSQEQLSKIEIDFYKFLADVMIETLLLASFSEKQIKERMVFHDSDFINQKAKEHGVIIAAFAHYAQWEYSSTYGAHTPYNVYGVYHPLTSQPMDEFFNKTRSRFKSIPIPMAKVAKQMIEDKRSGAKSIYALIADQTPPRGIIKKWIMFLDQPTAFFPGVERLSLKLNCPVLFLDFRRTKRGYYEAYATEIYDGVEKVDPYEITKRYAKKLEESIEREPYLWLWSHRRWKHFPQSSDDILS